MSSGGGGGGKKGSGQKVSDYYLSLHFGICAGPVNALRELYIGEKQVWSGQQRTQTSISIDQPGIFGGDTQEGGVGGAVEYLPGDSDQLLPSGLASRFSLTPSTCPGFRGISSFFMTGAGRLGGFWWGTNNPYLKSTWATVTSIPQTWYAAKSAIPDLFGEAKKKYIYISLSVASSMGAGSPSPLDVAKTAINGILDLVQAGIDGGYTYGVEVQEFSTGVDGVFDTFGYNSATDDLADLRAWVNSRIATGDGFDYRSVAGIFGAPLSLSVALVGGFDRRIFILASDGNCVPGTDDLAVASDSMADILSPTGGSFNVDAGSNVECFAMNLIASDTTHSAKMDNTVYDGVPIVGTDGAVPSGIGNAVGLDPTGPSDMNPAHIIYHALTNQNWGMGAPPSSLDETSFVVAADTLYSEVFGLSLMWVQQSTIEDFVKDVLGHINATLYVNPASGLLTLKLIRADYDADTLPVLDRDNSRIISFARKGWGDTVNEIVVTWTNPDSENTETFTLQDTGNIAMQGGVVSDSRNYYGIRNSALAQTVAARDLTAASWPLATAEVEANRTAWNYVPGEVLKLSATEYGVADIVMRIGTVDYGKPGDSRIRLSLVEDIFGLPLAQFVSPAPASLFVPPDEAPRAIDHALPQTLPYFMANRAADVSSAVYPEVLAGMLAAQTGGDTTRFELLGPTVDAAGNETPFADLGARTIVARAQLAADLAAEVQTSVTTASWTGLTQGEGPVVGGFALIGAGAETANELVLITSLVSGTYTLKRGVLDTTPKAWASGAAIWFFSANSSVADLVTRAALDTINYKVLPITSGGMLAEASATAIPLTLTERPYLPTRPANVKIDGIAFGPYDAYAAHAGSVPSTLPVVWANRNRLTEDSQPLAWDGSNVTPEAGQTTTVALLDTVTRAVIVSHAGLTGTSYDLALSDFGGRERAILRVSSSRDGYDSLQAHEIVVKVRQYSLDFHRSFNSFYLGGPV